MPVNSSSSLGAAARRVQATLAGHGLTDRVRELADSARSAVDAANALGCDVAQIAKSLVFRGTRSGSAVLVIASGPNRVDEKRVAEIVGEPIVRADAVFVRALTGFAIGGVPPIGHAALLRTLIDRDLLALESLWAAAGTPHAVFRLTADELVSITGGTVADVRTD